MNIEISVIIPTYKPKEYLWECLDSLKHQNLSKDEFEIFLILNGCNEPYFSQISEFVNDNLKELNICLIQIDIGGVSNARNIGIELSNGKYITFIDDDDFVSPTFLQDMLDVANHDTVVLSNSISFVDGSKQYDDEYKMKQAYEFLSASKRITLYKARSIFNGPCMKLIEKDIIKTKRFNTSFSNGEDSLFMFEISRWFKHIVLAAPTAIYYRRFRKNSATTTKRSLFYVIRNNVKIIFAYSKCLIKHPFSYNIPFYFSRIIAGIKNMIYK